MTAAYSYSLYRPKAFFIDYSYCLQLQPFLRVIYVYSLYWTTGYGYSLYSTTGYGYSLYIFSSFINGLTVCCCSLYKFRTYDFSLQVQPFTALNMTTAFQLELVWVYSLLTTTTVSIYSFLLGQLYLSYTIIMREKNGGGVSVTRWLNIIFKIGPLKKSKIVQYHKISPIMVKILPNKKNKSSKNS